LDNGRIDNDPAVSAIRTIFIFFPIHAIRMKQA